MKIAKEIQTSFLTLSKTNLKDTEVFLEFTNCVESLKEIYLGLINGNNFYVNINTVLTEQDRLVSDFLMARKVECEMLKEELSNPGSNNSQLTLVKSDLNASNDFKSSFFSGFAPKS